MRKRKELEELLEWNDRESVIRELLEELYEAKVLLVRRKWQIKVLKGFKEGIKAHKKLLFVLLDEEMERNSNMYPEINNECKVIAELINV